MINGDDAGTSLLGNTFSLLLFVNRLIFCSLLLLDFPFPVSRRFPNYHHPLGKKEELLLLARWLLGLGLARGLLSRGLGLARGLLGLGLARGLLSLGLTRGLLGLSFGLTRGLLGLSFGLTAGLLSSGLLGLARGLLRGLLSSRLLFSILRYCERKER